MIAAQRRESRVSGPRLLLDEVFEVNLAGAGSNFDPNSID
jgi:hypothetical protein